MRDLMSTIVKLVNKRQIPCYFPCSQVIAITLGVLPPASFGNRDEARANPQAILRAVVGQPAKVRLADVDGAAAQLKSWMARMILTPDAADDRRIRLRADALSRGGRYRRRRGACRARRREDVSDSPVFGVDQQNRVVIELDILKVLRGRNLSGDIRR